MTRTDPIQSRVGPQTAGSDLVERLATNPISRRALLLGAVGTALAGVAAGMMPSAGRVAAQAPKNVAIFASVVDIPNIDPAVGHDGAISVSQKHLYDTLYRHLGNPAQLVPWLATEHTVSPDATTWTFTLDGRAKFQDGSPVTADAVVYSAQRLLKINKGVAWMFTGILKPENVTAPDAKTVVFKLDKPYAPFLHATAWLFVLNPPVVDKNQQGADMAQAWLMGNSAGSGPFKIARWEPGNLYQFDADPNYWRGWDAPHVDGYIHQVSQESSTKRLALQNGEVQFADWLSPQDKALLSKVAGVVVPREASISTYTIKMNSQVGPTSDANVRRAISYAFDYGALIDVLAGFATRIAGPLSPSVAGAKTTPVYEKNLDLAKAELAKSAKYAGGFDLEFVYVTGLEEERQTGQIMLDSLKPLNINVKITGMEWTNAVALFADEQKSPAMFPIYSGEDFPDPDNFLWQSFHSSSAGTWTGANHYKNPALDKLLEDARATTDEAARTKLYDQAQDIVINDAVEVFLVSPLGGTPHRAEIKGYTFSPVMGSAPWWYEISMATS
jgi:peptide/nickel transport system substrate-binding protein